MRDARSSDGFTLIELMVVVVILGLLIGLVLPNVVGGAERAAIKTAETQMASFGQAIKMFYVDRRRLPTSLEELLEADPKTGQPWLDGKRVPKDPWDREYAYRTESASTWSIRSLGPDGSEGTPDDLEWPAP